MGAVCTAVHANPPGVMQDFGRRTLYSIQSWNLALLFWFRYFCPRGRGLDLDAMPPGCFAFQYLSKFKLVSSWGSLPWRSMRTDLFLWFVIDVWLLLSRLWTLFMPSSRSQHALSATFEMLGAITYCSATRVRISDTYLWWFWRCWSRHKCSTGSFAWVRGIVSDLMKAAAEVSTSEFDPVDFDNEVAEGITHLDVSPNLFHKVDFSSLARCFRFWLTVLATITSEIADNGGDKDLGISDEWIADNIAFQTRSSEYHRVWQVSFSNYFEELDQLPSLSPRHGLLQSTLQSIFLCDWHNSVSLQTLLLGKRIKIRSQFWWQLVGGRVLWYRQYQYNHMRCCQLRALHDFFPHMSTFLCQIRDLVTDAAHCARILYSAACAAHPAFCLGIGVMPIPAHSPHLFTELQSFASIAELQSFASIAFRVRFVLSSPLSPTMTHPISPLPVPYITDRGEGGRERERKRERERDRERGKEESAR